MGLLKRYFGEKTKDEETEYESAVELIDGLHQRGAQISRLLYKLVSKKEEISPSYERAVALIQTHLSPYQHEFDPTLRGITKVKHKIRDFGSHQMHSFDFTQFIDNLFRKGIKHHTARLEMRV